MENWGMLTYQEGGLLYEEGVSSLLHKEVIATLISHELAHQVPSKKYHLYLWIKVLDDDLHNFFSFFWGF